MRLFFCFLLQYFLDLFLVRVVLSNPQLIVGTQLVHTRMVVVSTHHIAPIVLTQSQLINTYLLSILITFIDCQFQRLAVILTCLFELKKLQAKSTHVHACHHS